MSRDDATYAGDIDVRTAWERLAEDPDAVLLDVRTTMEWERIGVPHLDPLGKQVRFVEWQTAPDMALNPAFAEQVAETGIAPEQPLYIICRSGARSANAAALLTALGHRRCFNVSDGFEGRPNLLGRRGTVEGWQWAGLPWRRGGEEGGKP